MARAMVCQYGMSDKLGMVQYGSDDEFVFLGREMVRTKVYSESTAREIDEEIKRIIDEGYQRAQNIIVDNRDKLELIANALLEYETLDRSQVEEIVQTGKFTPPPPKPQSGADDGRAGRHAAAGNPAQTRAAETARPGHAGARAGLRCPLSAFSGFSIDVHAIPKR